MIVPLGADFYGWVFARPNAQIEKTTKKPVSRGISAPGLFGHSSEDGCIVQNQRHAASTNSEHILRSLHFSRNNCADRRAHRQPISTL
jgi:hypothetical protein